MFDYCGCGTRTLRKTFGSKILHLAKVQLNKFECACLCAPVFALYSCGAATYKSIMATKICKLCLLRKKIASCASYRVVRLLNTSTAQKSKPNRFDADETESNKTHFGFKTVDKDEKQGKGNSLVSLKLRADDK